MPTNTLTDSQCRSAKAGEKARKLFDGGGLHLYISPKGSRTWRLAITVNNILLRWTPRIFPSFLHDLVSRAS